MRFPFCLAFRFFYHSLTFDSGNPRPHSKLRGTHCHFLRSVRGRLGAGKACPFTAALIADLLLVRHIIMMLNLRKRIQTQLPVGSFLTATGDFRPSGIFIDRGIIARGWIFGRMLATVSPDHCCHSICSRQTCSRSLMNHLTRKSPETGIHRSQDYRLWQEWVPRASTSEYRFPQALRRQDSPHPGSRRHWRPEACG